MAYAYDMGKLISEDALSAGQARELLDYNADTGEMRWKIRRGKVAAGSLAGTVDPWSGGYIRITIGYRLFPAHRLAHLIFYGWWPRGEIDHVNGNPADNCIDNLRDVTRSQNHANMQLSGYTKRNQSGVKGISWDMSHRKWRSAICKDNVRRFLGFFETQSEAHAAYHSAAAKLFGEYARPKAM